MWYEDLESNIVEYALHFIGKPYRWGGKGPIGLDCSGLVCEALKAFGIVKTDLDAQSLFKVFLQVSARVSTPKIGSLLFYGPNEVEIKHVAIALDDAYIVEAGGGGHLIVTLDLAESAGAMVRVRRNDYRMDLIACLVPNYQTLLLRH